MLAGEHGPVPPKGRDSAHQLINESTAVTRLLILSTMREPHGCAYPGQALDAGRHLQLTKTVDYLGRRIRRLGSEPARAGARVQTCRIHEPPAVLSLPAGPTRTSAIGYNHGVLLTLTAAGGGAGLPAMIASTRS